MASLYILIPVAFVFAAIAIRLLLWAIDNGQYDDLDKEGSRILMDDEPLPPAQTPANKKNEDTGQKSVHQKDNS
ncbi:MAG: cbb3-type cytochrome oxidase assembly protein CcoS [Parahaliea sp.]